MSKKDLATSVQQSTGISGTKANEVAGDILNHIVEVLKSEGTFALPGIGVLAVKETKARDARNPKTGAVIKVPAGKTVRFRVSSVLKKVI